MGDEEKLSKPTVFPIGRSNLNVSVGELGLQNLRPVVRFRLLTASCHTESLGLRRGTWSRKSRPHSASLLEESSLPHPLLSLEEPRAQESRPSLRGTGAQGRAALEVRMRKLSHSCLLPFIQSPQSDKSSYSHHPVQREGC